MTNLPAHLPCLPWVVWVHLSRGHILPFMFQSPFFPFPCLQTDVPVHFWWVLHLSFLAHFPPITSYNPGWTAVLGFCNQEAWASQAPSISPHSINQSWCRVHLRVSPCPGVNVFWNLFVKRKCVLQRKEHELWLAQSDHCWQGRQGTWAPRMRMKESCFPGFVKSPSPRNKVKVKPADLWNQWESRQASKKSVGVSEVRWGQQGMESRGLIVWEISLLKANHHPQSRLEILFN